MFLSTRRSLHILQTWGYIRFPTLSFFGNLKARVRSAPFTSYAGQGRSLLVATVCRLVPKNMENTPRKMHDSSSTTS